MHFIRNKSFRWLIKQTAFLLLLPVINAIAAENIPVKNEMPIDMPLELMNDNHLAMSMEENLTMPGREIIVNFELTGIDNRVIRDEDFLGKYLLLTFGFTHCEHICPLMAATIGNVLKSSALPSAGLFISVDPERDSAAIINNYAQVFSERFTGVSGQYDAINRAAENFLISYVVTKTQQSYTVSHTANIFLIGPDGDLLEIFPLNAAPQELTDAMLSHAN